MQMLTTLSLDRTSEAMRFSVNASERMRIDSSGNVGIGTSAPSAKLHIDDNAASGAGLLVTGGGGGQSLATFTT